MKTFFKLSIFIFLMGLFSTVSYADIQITVYGSGGIVILPDGTQKVCPDPGSGVCAKIKMPDLKDLQEKIGSGGMEGILIYKGESSSVMILELPGLREENGELGCQGAVFQPINQ